VTSFMQRPYDGGYDRADVPPIYGDETYEKPLQWLLETCDSIEDWGCGYGYARKFVPEGRYRGIDGSPEAGPYADEITDLTKYTSSADGIFIRHILEHNWDWRDILENAIGSFRKRMVLILFTPFAKHTDPLTMGPFIDLSFRREDITDYFTGLDVTEEHLVTNTQYRQEHLFYLERPA
jgi:SAM-dependent methyltransferase